jgi:hypothetical protein
VVPNSQAGFRKGRGTMENLYILADLTKNKLKKKTSGRVFEEIDRKKMFGCKRKRERERGIRE